LNVRGQATVASRVECISESIKAKPCRFGSDSVATEEQVELEFGTESVTKVTQQFDIPVIEFEHERVYKCDDGVGQQSGVVHCSFYTEIVFETLTSD
jgi:hypothetical protein